MAWYCLVTNPFAREVKCPRAPKYHSSIPVLLSSTDSCRTSARVIANHLSDVAENLDLVIVQKFNLVNYVRIVNGSRSRADVNFDMLL